MVEHYKNKHSKEEREEEAMIAALTVAPILVKCPNCSKSVIELNWHRCSAAKNSQSSAMASPSQIVQSANSNRSQQVLNQPGSSTGTIPRTNILVYNQGHGSSISVVQESSYICIRAFEM